LIYKPEELRKIHEISLISIRIEDYASLMQLFKKAMGHLYHSDSMMAKFPEYKKPTINFSRFSFDFISLMGKNLLSITPFDFHSILQ